MTHQPALVAALIVATIAALTDLRSRTVPNWLVAAGAAAGLSLGLTGGGAGPAGSLLGGLAGFCVFFPFYLLRGMGGGDVKLMGALGACLGPVAILQVAVVASLAGAILALGVAARQGALAGTLAGVGRLLRSWILQGPRPDPGLSLDNPRALTIPYALPIAAGAALIVLTAS